MEKVVFGKRVPPSVEETLAADALSKPLHEERRQAHRPRVLKGADIRFNKGYGAYSCTVKNLTNDGAMVFIEDCSGLPAEFDFVIKGEENVHRASIAWHKVGKAGLRFH